MSRNEKYTWKDGLRDWIGGMILIVMGLATIWIGCIVSIPRIE